MELDKIVESISDEMGVALRAMGKAKTPEEKLVQSEIVKNLSEALGVLLRLGLASDPDLFDEYGEPMPF